MPRAPYPYTPEQLAERYECAVCRREIGIVECDRNLIAAWPHCDSCMADLMAQYRRDMRRDWPRRPWRRLVGWFDRSPVRF